MRRGSAPLEVDMPAKKARGRTAKKRSPSRPRPVAMQGVVPYLTVEGGAEAIAFYRKAFGAKLLRRTAAPDGKIIHASLELEGSAFMLSDLFSGADTASPKGSRTSPVTIHINSSNVDRLWAKALKAGATATMPLDDQFWGDRYGKITDPFGHHWSMSQPGKLTPAELKAKQAEAMAMFAGDEPPG